MALTDAAARAEIHTRRIEIKGYRRDDGLFDIEGHMQDRRPTAFEMSEGWRSADQAMHDLWIRLTIDRGFNVISAEAAMPTGAFSVCHEIAPNFASLKGLRIGPGWNKAVRERVGGVRGCTHIVEMLSQVATTAIQSLWDEAEPAGTTGTEGMQQRTQQLNSCHAYRSDGPMVRRFYPAQYSGELAAVAAAGDEQAGSFPVDG